MVSMEAAKIKEALQRILESEAFISHERQSKLLAYIVKATLNYDNEALKARNIAMAVFERGDDFNSSSDSVVRIEAAKLRNHLKKYYFDHPDEPLIINIPKGSYSAVFSLNTPQPVESAGVLPFEEAPLPEGYNCTILIMPFGITGDRENAERLGVGILNEISISLTRFYDLNVIDCSFHVPSLGNGGETPAMLAEMRRNARFVLEGHVHAFGDVFKIWTILRDSKTNFNIWSDKFEGSFATSSEFVWQEGIAESIVYKIAGEFGAINKARSYELVRNGENISLEQKAFLLYDIWAASMTRVALEEALEAAEAAALAFPENMNLQTLLADLYLHTVEYGGKASFEDVYARVFQIVSRVLAYSPDNQMAHLLSAFYYFEKGEIDRFFDSAERAVQINPSNAHVLISLSASYGLLDRWDIALSYVDKVRKLSPGWPKWAHTVYALYNYINGDYAAAYSEALEIYPSAIIWNPLIRLFSASMLEQKEQARLALHDLLEAYPLFLKNSGAILQRMARGKISHKALCCGLDKSAALLGLTLVP